MRKSMGFQYYIQLLIRYQIYSMECTKCNLRFNTTVRKPTINQCGHTFCEACGNKMLQCPVCKTIIDKTKSNINHSLYSILQQKHATKDVDKFIKVCFVGESKVGKTSLITRLKGQEYRENTITTIGYDFAFEDRMIDEHNVRFQLWDSAGQQRYRAISPLHYKNSDIVVIVYDVTQDGKSNNVCSWYEEAVKHCPEKAIKILVGNKTDLLDRINKKSSFNALDSATWNIIASEKINYYQISCKTYEGIQEFWGIMEENVRIIMKRIVIPENPFKDTSVGKGRSSTPHKGKREGKKLKTGNSGKSREGDCEC